MFDALVPIIVAVLFFGLGLGWFKGIRQGRPLTPFMKSALFYAPIFILGLGYLMMLAGDLHWSSALLFSLSFAWALLILLVARWHHRMRKE